MRSQMSVQILPPLLPKAPETAPLASFGSNVAQKLLPDFLPVFARPAFPPTCAAGAFAAGVARIGAGARDSNPRFTLARRPERRPRSSRDSVEVTLGIAGPGLQSLPGVPVPVRR